MLDLKVVVEGDHQGMKVAEAGSLREGVRDEMSMQELQQGPLQRAEEGQASGG